MKKIKEYGLYAENNNVGGIVPLPNHYTLDMPQGQGRCKPAFFLTGIRRSPTPVANLR
jgi:hypothetical protein